MDFNSKRTSLIILIVTALMGSRAMFSLFNDPEGPNLLVVMVVAAIIYVLSLGVYSLYPSTTQGGQKKLLLAVLVQIMIVTGLYFFLN